VKSYYYEFENKMVQLSERVGKSVL